LQWNSSDYGNLTQVVLSPELVWLPDFGVENRQGTHVIQLCKETELFIIENCAGLFAVGAIYTLRL
jgi:hypothetical protein